MDIIFKELFLFLKPTTLTKSFDSKKIPLKFSKFQKSRSSSLQYKPFPIGEALTKPINISRTNKVNIFRILGKFLYMVIIF